MGQTIVHTPERRFEEAVGGGRRMTTMRKRTLRAMPILGMLLWATAQAGDGD